MAAAGPSGPQLAAFAGVVGAGVLAVDLARAPRPTARLVRSFNFALSCAVAVFSYTGLTILVGPAIAAGLCLLLALTCPVFVTAAGRWFGSGPTSVPDPAPEPPASPFLDANGPLPSLTTAELCAAWQHSSVALDKLQHSGTTQAQCRVVAARQHYLDELERRNPAGFARWVQQSAGAVADPSRYLLSRRPGQR